MTKYGLAFWVVFCLGAILTCWCSGGDDDDDSGGGDNDDDYGDDYGDDDDSGGDDDNDAGDDDISDDDDDTGETWTDPSSGLTWQVTPSDYMTWDAAMTYCPNLNLAGGGWSLPSISALRTLIWGCDATVTGGSCGVTDTCLDSQCFDWTCYGCAYGSGPNNGCYGTSELPNECDWFWSSSKVSDDPGFANTVGFHIGCVQAQPINDVHLITVRCVR